MEVHGIGRAPVKGSMRTSSVEEVAFEGLKGAAMFGDEEMSGGADERRGYRAMLTAARALKFEIINGLLTL